MPSASCPECDSDVQVESYIDVGDTVDCEECGVELEIVGIDPLELDVVDDYPDYDDDEEDDL